MILTEDEMWFWFTNIKGIGRKTRTYLLNYFSEPYNIYNADEKEILKLEFLTGDKKEELIKSRNNNDIKKAFYLLNKKNISFVHMNSEKYPEKLRLISDCPHALYLKGSKNFFSKPMVSIVGSRKCSKYGYETAYKIGYELALHGISVVSGMASGIDSAAHKGCIGANGYTVAVLGCGVDICYPKHNIDLYMNIQKNGVIVSEYPFMTYPKPGLFPERNRIISGLSDITVVVEAGEKSGTFITVDMALEQGRDVYVVPGRITDRQSMGCNSLIAQGANVFLNIDDILAYFDNMLGNKKNNGYNSKLEEKNNFKTNEFKLIYDYIKIMPKHIDDIAKVINIPVRDVMQMIFDMELKGIIKHYGNNYYSI